MRKTPMWLALAAFVMFLIPQAYAERPSVELVSEIQNGGVTNRQVLSFIVQFDGNVTGFESGDVFALGETSEFLPHVVDFRQISPSMYAFEIFRGPISGPITISIPANSAFNADGMGNTASNQYVITIDVNRRIATGPEYVFVGDIYGMEFSDDGYRLFISDDEADNIRQYGLARPFMLDGRIIQETLELENTNVRGLAFSGDGHIMFVADEENSSIIQYDLPEPYNIGRAAMGGVTNLTGSAAAPPISPQDILFSEIQSTMLVTNGIQSIHRYNLSTPYNVTSATYTESYHPANTDVDLSGIEFSRNGHKIFATGTSFLGTVQYITGVRENIRHGTIVGSYMHGDLSFRALAFSNDGYRLFAVNADEPIIHEFSLAIPYTLLNTEIIYVERLEDHVLREDFEPLAIDLSDHFTEIDGDVIIFELAEYDDTVVNVVIDGNIMRISPVNDAFGETEIIILVGDRSVAYEEAFTIMVDEVNDPPVNHIPFEDVEKIEDFEPFTVELGGRFFDRESDTLEYSVRALDKDVAETSIEGTTVTVTSIPNAHGNTTIRIIANDTQDVVRADFNLLVTEANELPEGDRFDDLELREDFGNEIIDVASHFNTIGAEFAVLSDSDLVGLEINGDQLHITSVQDAHGNTTVTIRAHLGTADREQDFEIIVTPVNDAPVPVARGDITLREDFGVERIDLAQYFTDVDGDELKYGEAVTGGIIRAGISGNTLELRSIENLHGDTLVEITANDGDLGATSAVAIMVLPENDPPYGELPTRYSLVENFKPFTINLNDRFGDPENDTLVYTAETKNIDLFGRIVDVQVNGVILTIDSVPDRTGLSRIEVTASDAEFTITRQASVVIRAGMTEPPVDTPTPDDEKPPDNKDPGPDDPRPDDDLEPPSTIDPKNNRPLADKIADVVVMEDFDAFTIDLDDHFFDPEDTNLTYGLRPGGSGTVLINLNGSGLNVEPVPDAHGTREVVIIAVDTERASADKTFNFIVTPVNDPPVAVGSFTDVARVEDFDAFPVSLAGHFADVDGDELDYTAVAAPEYVLLDITGESIRIRPVPDAHGNVTVTVTADDGAKDVGKEFAMQIEPANDPPVLAIPFDDIVLNEDFGIERIVLEGHFTDVDSEPAYDILIDNPAATVSIEEGEIVMRSISNIHGTATITVTADGVPASFGLDVMPVNDPPRATAILGGDIFEANFAPYMINLDDFFTDVDEDELTYTAGTEGGIITVEITQRSILGIGPVFDAHGGAAVSITVSDGSAEISDRFTIRVNEPKRAPEVKTTLPDRVLPEDFGSDRTDLSAHFTDMNGDELTFDVTSTGEIIGTAIIQDTLVLSSMPDINGNTTVTVTANDGNLDGQDDFELVISPVNDAPVLDVEFQDMIVDEGFDAFEIGLDVHFADVDGDELSYSVETDGGTVTAGIIRDDTLEVSSRGMAYGDVMISVTASDAEESASGTFTLEVRRINEVPTSQSIPDRTIDEDFEAFDVRLADHFSDFDGDVLEYTVTESETDIISHDVSEGILTISSIPDVHGNTTIQVTADDGIANVAESFEIVVRPVNDAPVSLGISNILLDEDFVPFEIELDEHFSDPDGDILEYSVILFGKTVTVNIRDGNILEISSIKDETSNPTVRVTASDGMETAEDLFILIIIPVNDAPVLDELPDRAVQEDFGSFTIDLSGHFSDPDGDALAYDVTGQDDLVTTSVSGNVLTAESIQDAHGSATLRISATDGEATIQDEFVLTVTPVNDAPVLSSPFNDITRDEDFDSFAIEVQSHFTDVDGDVLTYGATVVGGAATVSIVNNMLEISSTSMEFGSATITVTASDGDGETASGAFVLMVDSVNDVPVLDTSLPDLTRDEDFEVFTIDLSDHFSDPDGNGLDYTVSGQDGVVTAAVSGNVLTVESIQDVNGAATLAISATDGEATIQDSFEMTVMPVNDPPVLSSPFNDITRDEDFATFMIDPSGNFTDVDGDELTYDATSVGDAATVSIVNNMLEITAASMEFGSATITVTASDPDGETASDEFILTVESVNDAPVLDSPLPDVTRDEDFEAFTIDLSIHFSDPDGNNLNYAVDNQGEIVTTGISGSILTVSSVLNAHGNSTLTITASDETESIQDSFEMTVTPVNDAPVLSSPFNDITRNEDFATFMIDPSGNFTDVDEDELTYAVAADVDVVTVRITDDNMLEITSTDMAFGGVTITVTATDGDGETASGTFGLTVDSVNDEPIQNLPLQDRTEDEDFNSLTIDLSDHFGDPDGGNLDYTVTGQDGIITTDVSGNILTISSIQNVHGTATLAITASDGSESIQDSFEMTVTPVNDAPVLSSPFNDITRDEDFDSFEIEVESHFTDVDEDVLTYDATSVGNAATVSIVNNMLEISSIDMAFGDVTITVMATDVAGETASDEFILTVDSVNDVPVLGTSLPDLTRDEDFDTVTIDLSIHFSDPDGGSLDYTVSGQGGIVTATVSGNTLTVESIQDVNGAATLRISATDGEATTQDEFEMMVTPVNDAPVLSSLFEDITRNEDFATITIDPSDHFADVDGDALTYGATVVGSAATVSIVNNMLEISSTSMEFGSATITVTARDGAEETASDEFILTVDSVNDVPVLGTSLPDLTRDEDFEAFTIDLSIHFSDPDGDALTYEVTGQDDLVTTSVSGNTLTVESIQDLNGEATLRISATDSEATIRDEFKMTVNPVNDPPTLVTPFNDITRDEDFVPFEIEIESHFADVDGDNLTYDATAAGDAATVRITENDMLEFSSIPMAFGSTTITVTATDIDGETARGTFTMMVDSINDAPVQGLELPDVTEEEDFAPFEIDLSSHFGDPDGGNLDYTVTGQDGIVTTDVSGNIMTISSIQDLNGAVTLMITASDGPESIQDSFVMTVTPVNDAPVLSSPFNGITRDEDFAAITIDPSGNFTDVDGDVLTYDATSDVGVVTAGITNNGVLEIIAASMEFGSATITVTATDGDGETARGTFVLTVDSVNDAPVLDSPLPDVTRDEDFEAFTVMLSDHFRDPDGTGLEYTVNESTGGVVSLSIDGSTLTIDPIQNAHGNTMLTITASDGPESIQDSFEMTVTPVNDAPVLSSPFNDITRDEDFVPFEIEVASHFTDVDGDDLTYGATADVDVVSVVITSDDMLEITATSMAFGSATITVTAGDPDGETASDEFILTVDSVNDVPVLGTSLPDLTRDEDFEAFTIDLSIHFSDPDGGSLDYTVEGQDGVVTTDVSGNVLTVESIQDLNGAATLMITASDGSESIQDSFEMTVTPVNDAPVLSSPFNDITRDEDFVSFEIEVESHFTDIDGDDLAYDVTVVGGAATAGITGSNMLEITSTAMAFGGVTITVTATDIDGETARGTFVLTVDSINDAPILDSPLPDVTRDEDFGVILIDLSIHFSDPDGDALEFDVTGPASLISASASGNTLTLGSLQDLNGEATFEITATDGRITIRDELKMTVNPVNDPPTLETGFVDLGRDESFAPFEIEIESHFADVDGDDLTYNAMATGGAARVEITEADMLKISSVGMAFGDVVITIAADDGMESARDTFVLEVGYVNDIPVIDMPLLDVTMLEDFEPFEIRLGDHFSDPDSDSLAYELVVMEPNILRARISGEMMEVSSVKDANGNSTITVSASDGMGEIRDTMKVTVTPVTDPFRIIVPNISSSYPVAEPIRLQFLIADDEDITGPIVFSTVDDSATGYGSITVDGVFEWTPEQDGEFDLMVTAIDVSDPRNSDMAMVALHVAESGDDGTNSQWRTKPTFGVSYIWGDKLVDCGYSMDGTCRDVLSYHVDYTEHIRTNSTHDFELKTSAPNGLRMLGIGFGVDGIGFPVNTAEAQITVRLERDYDSDSTYSIVGTEYDDKNGIISHNAGVSIKREKCLPTDKEDTCVVLSIKDVTFREEMYDTPFVIHALDSKRYTTVHYMNDGLEVTGKSMNAPPQYNITRHVLGQPGTTDLTLVRTDKLADVWTDQLGYQWTKNSYGTWMSLTTPSPNMASACTDVNKRSCDAFGAKLEWHMEKMEDLRDAAYGVRAPEFDGTGGR